MYPIDIIGIGQGRDDLTQKHLDCIQACDVLVGGRRHLAMFDCPDKQKIVITAPLDSIVSVIKEKMTQKKIVVLASGDPLFYGIGATLTRYFDKDLLRIHANISSVSAAFAAIKEPWHDARIVSLHGKPGACFSFAELTRENKAAILTDPENTPGHIADCLIKEGLYDFRFCVLEQLGNPEKEKITWFDTLDRVREASFSQPNLVILQKRTREPLPVSHETHIGMPDALFRHSRGLITKSEVRSITLSKLKLIKKDHVLWDIGSGSGSVGIEASFHLPWGHVYAIEKHSGRISDIVHNIKNFNCSNVKVVNATFPAGMDELKTPDRIIIGGGGKHLDQVIIAACDRLAPFGIMVINTVLLQTLEIAVRLLKENNFNPDIVQIQVSRSKAMPFGDRLEALNPVWIITGSKPEARKTI